MTSLLRTFIATAALTLVPVYSVSALQSNETWLALSATTVDLTQEQVRAVYAVSRPAEGIPHLDALRFDLFLPDGAPKDTQLLFHLKDADGFWFQYLLPRRLGPGETNQVVISLAADATGWEPVGHHGAWNFRSSLDPSEIGMKIFSRYPFAGETSLMNVEGRPCLPDPSPPVITSVLPGRKEIPCYEKFEVLFLLPDRYDNPFDTNIVWASALIREPNGIMIEMPAFYSQAYYRTTDGVDDNVLPQGRPCWCVRFAPRTEGRHTYTICVRDSTGETSWGPASFTALQPRTPGFVRASAADPRFFEFSNTDYFFPIGQNFRSPYDVRYHQKLPLRKRWPKDNSYYEHYFRKMKEHDENFAEVWFAPWSLAIEWTPERRGYHGIGRYNLIHAWEMDVLLDQADAADIFLNLVIHNHGKFSSFSDQQWNENPFNVKNGGYLERPEDYFSDPRARASFAQLMRYTIARWSYSRRVMSWELWSELNLTGSNGNTWNDPKVREWHRWAADLVHGMDPYRHLVGTHVSGSHGSHNRELMEMPEIDFVPANGYHGGENPVQIVDVLVAAAKLGESLNKPVLITEFGGNWDSASSHLLKSSLHAALWASPCTTMPSTPLFWWWEFIDEQNCYPEYAAIAAFVEGEDRRGPNRSTEWLRVETENGTSRDIKAIAFKDDSWGLGWIYRPASFRLADLSEHPPATNAQLIVSEMKPGNIVVEFWDTSHGHRISSSAIHTDKTTVRIPVPEFRRDIAFKIRSVTTDPSTVEP